MLKFLHIENIAVIEKTDIEFKEGFNVLTGETGAGKSIVIDAINAVLGERTSKDLIRTGCENAIVSAVFCDVDKKTCELLSENGISPDEDGFVIITRKLSLNGKGLIKINNIPITATVLRDISKYLINIHGQHDNQALLNPEMHLGFIDAVAENHNLIDEYYKEFKQLNLIRKELNALQIDEDEKIRKTDLLKYQINELETANIQIGEFEELKRKLEIANNFEKIQKNLSAADYLLSGDDEKDGAVTQVSNSIKHINSLGNDFENTASKLNTALSLIMDAKSEVGNFLENNDLSQLDPNEINHRLDFLSKLMIKYGSTEELMLDYLEKAKSDLEYITLSDEKINELNFSLEQSKIKLIEKAQRITDSRIVAAEKFSKEVCDILSYLNMPNVRFVTEIKQGRYTKNGCDSAEFLISANDGESLKPLQKIASGGELSRVMLSIKSVLLDKDDVDTMIFDEIDTGISGYAAGKVATQLKKVASARQVICVTHLAQIAAVANEHLLIEKSSQNGHTFTQVTTLDYNKRISEIARIMSGTELTENLYNSAKELIDRSNLL